MRRPVLLLTSAVVPAILVGLFQGCSSEPPVEDLCGWISSNENCYLGFHKVVQDACAPANPAGSFQTRMMLDTCVIAQGGSVVFDPPIDLTMLPLGLNPDAGKMGVKMTFMSPTGMECGNVTYDSQYSFSLTIDTPDGGAMGADGGGMAGADGGAIFGGTFTATTPVGRDTLDVACPNSLEKHHFDRLQVTGSDTMSNSVNGCPVYANIIPQAILEVSPGGIQAMGFAKLTIRFPPTAGVDKNAMAPPVPDDVVYFNCTIPGAPLQCQNGIKDTPPETDVDCGGTESSPNCPPRCVAGQACNTDCDCDATSSCQVDVMDMGKKKCAPGSKMAMCAPLICADGKQDSTETDVDCGGGCPGCADGKKCAVGTDCQSGSCMGFVCTAPNCMDKAKNGAETGVDCGGPTCPKCPDGQGCVSSTDCMNNDCGANNICSPCGNGMQDGTESDIDCGGATCPKCPDTKKCNAAADCANGNCFMNTCVSCMDALKDGTESDVDCGGSCPKCAETKTCNTGADCMYGVCDTGFCNTCNDKKKDGVETDVDCGGASCPKCASGQGCMTNADCATSCNLGTKKCN